MTFKDFYSQIKVSLASAFFSQQIANQLVAIFELAFVNHLQDSMDFFGRNSSRWETAYTLYLDEVVKSVEKVVVVERELLTCYTPAEIQIWDHLGQALQLVRKRFANEALFLPPNLGSIPFLSPSFVSGLLECLQGVQTGYTLVSVFISSDLTTYQLVGFHFCHTWDKYDHGLSAPGRKKLQKLLLPV